MSGGFHGKSGNGMAFDIVVQVGRNVNQGFYQKKEEGSFATWLKVIRISKDKASM